MKTLTGLTFYDTIKTSIKLERLFFMRWNFQGSGIALFSRSFGNVSELKYRKMIKMKHFVILKDVLFYLYISHK